MDGGRSEPANADILVEGGRSAVAGVGAGGPDDPAGCAAGWLATPAPVNTRRLPCQTLTRLAS